METILMSTPTTSITSRLTPILFGFLSLFFGQDLFAQVMISDGGTVTTCGDVFYDDQVGAAGDGGPYTDNDYILTLCPDEPGTAVSVTFLGFDVQTNPNPNNSDVLYVFDGETTGAPMVGAGSGNLFEDMTITASINNPTGCLTFQFVCNNGASGGDIGWAADISCVTPCTYPASAFSLTDPDPFDNINPSVGVCPLQDVSFDGSASTADGVPLADWIWNWGDGNVETTNSPLATHNYEEPGEYLVTLVVEDENQCNSVNLEPYQVLVSTIPIFNASFSSPLCTGSPGFLDGNPVQSITWTALPPLAVSESEPLPDATGIPFTSELFIDFFDPDQVLEDCDDLMSFSAIIEHSFIGDLTMWITCPDGTEVLIMDNGASGGVDPSGCNNPDLGGNDLGEPVYGDGGGSPIPGVGYEYSWSTEGEYVLDDPDNPNLDGFNAVPAGLYATCGDICDLVGCPLNGIWEFNILDQWAADNGFLFEWGIDFNPAIVPGVTTFTPTIGANMDSSYWQVSTSTYGVETIDAQADYVDLMFDLPGSYPFTYTVTNNFSCSWDTIVNIEVVPGLGNSVTAGADLIFCQNPVQLEGAFVGGGASPCSNDEGTVNYCYGNNAYDVFTYCPDVLGDGTMMTVDFSSGMVEAFWDAVNIYDGDSDAAPLIATVEGDLSGLTYTATNADGCLTVVYV
jgi:PKD repeat protein